MIKVQKILGHLLIASFIFLVLSLVSSLECFAEDSATRVVRLKQTIEALKALSADDFDGVHDAAVFLSHQKYSEVSEQLISAVRYEIKHTKNMGKEGPGKQSMNLGLMFQAISGLRNMALPKDIDSIKKLRALFNVYTAPILNPLAEGPKLVLAIQKLFKETLDVAAIRGGKLPSLVEEIDLVLGEEEGKEVSDLLLDNDSHFKSTPTAQKKLKESDFLKVSLNKVSLEQVERIKKHLEETVIGQPEWIDMFTDLEMRNHIFAGQRTKSEKIVLMGQPGIGKDTIARSYVDAVHNKKDAYKDHLREISVPTSKADLWKAFGSNNGYLGSENLSPLVRWIAQHSAGRYIIVEGQGKAQDYIIENKEWKKGFVFENTFTPEQGVLFLNEFHNWPKKLTDLFLKQALDNGGTWPINNPGPGIDKMEVPLTIVIATNAGLGLVTSREMNGERYGEPFTYAESIGKWNLVHGDKQRLRDELKKSHRGINSAQGGEDSELGLSEEFANRIEDYAIGLGRPLSPDDLVKIAVIKMKEVKEKLAESTAGYNIELEWDDQVPKIVQEYKFQAEDNARFIGARVSEMIETTLLSAIRNKEIKESESPQKIRISMRKNEDHTISLNLSGSVNLTLPIKATLNDVPPLPMTDDEIDKWANIEKDLTSQVFGVDLVAKEIAKHILLSQEGRSGVLTEENATKPARIILGLGPSSTGKTELAKAIARVVYGSERAMKTFPFGHIKTELEMRKEFFGTTDAHGNSYPSKFMKEFDRNNGHVLINADEFGNCPPELIAMLYDLFREPVVRIFSDGKPRIMSNVFIIGTGNTGEQWYKDIPRHAPRDQQRAAMDEIYRQAMKDSDYRRKFLEGYFTEATLNRIGEENIYFFAPLNFKAVRQVTVLKLDKTVEALKPKPSQRGWDIKFLNKGEYENALTNFENEGFILREQGASIDRSVTRTFNDSVRHLLLINKVPIGAKVGVYEVSRTEANYADETFGTITYGLLVNDSKTPLTFEMKRLEVSEQSKILRHERILTGYHEAGHEMVRRALFPDKYRSNKMTIIPGVASINDLWILYLGLVQYSRIENIRITREQIVSFIASFSAGYVAETLVTKNGSHDAGKQNDMERATELAQTAVLKLGLSEAFGKETAPHSMSAREYASSLTGARKALYESEYLKILTEGENLARKVMAMPGNFEKVLIPLANEVIERGTLYREDLNSFYNDRESVFKTVKNTNFFATPLFRASSKPGRMKENSDGFLDFIPMPRFIANIEEITAEKKRKQIAEIQPKAVLPVWTKKDGFHNPKSVLPSDRSPGSSDGSGSGNGSGSGGGSGSGSGRPVSCSQALTKRAS